MPERDIQNILDDLVLDEPVPGLPRKLDRVEQFVDVLSIPGNYIIARGEGVRKGPLRPSTGLSHYVTGHRPLISVTVRLHFGDYSLNCNANGMPLSLQVLQKLYSNDTMP